MPRALARRSRRFFSAFVFFLFLRRLALPLGQSILQRELQFFDGGMRKNHAVIFQQVIRMNLVARYELETFNVARAQFQIAIGGVRRFHDQHRLFNLERLERGPEFLGLRLLHVERVHNRQLAIGKLRRQRRAQRAQKLFARKRVVVGARDRPVHRAAVPPEWRTDRANTRAPRALLLPQLLARTGNLPAGLGRVRAAVLPGAVMLHRFPEQVFVDRTENFVGEIEGPDLGAAQIVNINSCHIALGTPYFRLLRRPLRRLQRIDRSRTRKSAALSGRLLRLHDYQISTLRPRNTAFHHQQILFFVHTQHPQVALRHARMTHVSRHAHSLEHARRKRRRTNRTRNLKHRAVRLRTAGEMMPLNDTLEAFALAHSHDVDKLFAFEYLDQHPVADLHRDLAIGGAIGFEPHFAHELYRRKIVLGQMSARRLGQPRLLHKFDQTNLSRFVTVLHRQLVLGHYARTSLQHCNRTHVALRVKQLRHADLLAQNACNSYRHLRLHPAWLVAC